jgi:hypothetical protein
MVIADDHSILRQCDVVILLMVNDCHDADLPDDHWIGFSHTIDTTVFLTDSRIRDHRTIFNRKYRSIRSICIVQLCRDSVRRFNFS